MDFETLAFIHEILCSEVDWRNAAWEKAQEEYRAACLADEALEEDSPHTIEMRNIKKKLEKELSRAERALRLFENKDWN